MIILESAPCGVYVHKSLNYKGVPEYILVYGLHVEHFKEFKETIERFIDCVKHCKVLIGDNHD